MRLDHVPQVCRRPFPACQKAGDLIVTDIAFEQVGESCRRGCTKGTNQVVALESSNSSGFISAVYPIFKENCVT